MPDIRRPWEHNNLAQAPFGGTLWHNPTWLGWVVAWAKGDLAISLDQSRLLLEELALAQFDLTQSRNEIQELDRKIWVAKQLVWQIWYHELYALGNFFFHIPNPYEASIKRLYADLELVPLELGPWEIIDRLNYMKKTAQQRLESAENRLLQLAQYTNIWLQHPQ